METNRCLLVASLILSWAGACHNYVGASAHANVALAASAALLGLAIVRHFLKWA